MKRFLKLGCGTFLFLVVIGVLLPKGNKAPKVGEQQPAAQQATQQVAAPSTPIQQPPSPAVPQRKQSDLPAASSAIGPARDYVRKFLKHPLDAKFDWIPDVKEFPGMRSYVVSGQVKAPNDLGAMLTQAYVVKLWFSHDRVWQLREVMLNGEAVYSNPEPIPRAPMTAAQLEEKKLADDEARAIEEKQNADAAESARLAAQERKIKASAEKLRLAKKWIKDERPETARKWLKELLKEYPGTEAAQEGERLLDGLR